MISKKGDATPSAAPERSDGSPLALLGSFGDMLDALEIGMCAFDSADCALCWNRTFLKLFPEHDGHIHVGESYGANLKRFYTTRLDGDELGRIAEYIQRGVARHHAQNRPFQFEHRGRRLTAMSEPVEQVGRVRMWRADRPLDLGAIPFVLDFPGPITEPSSAAKVLLNHVPDGLMICGEGGRIHWVNEPLVAIYGLPDGQAAVGRDLESIYRGTWSEAGSESPLFNAGLAALAENLRFVGAPFELPLPGDRYVRVISRPADGAAVFYAHIDISELMRQQRQLAQDIDERKKVEIALNAARETAAAASLAKSQFLAHMSHEIRTPLNAILTLAQLLDDDVPNAERRRMAQSIRAAGSVLLTSLNEVLDLAKIEAGQLGIERRPFSLDESLRTVEGVMRNAAQGKGLELAIENCVAGDPVLHGDPTRVQQVLFNLLNNAIKFTESGKVTLRITERARTATTLPLRFEVRDTGIGIPSSRLPALFTPFTQADNGITRRFGGTGLGLAISRRLVELMGGEIGVESVEGVGSTFWFEVSFQLIAASVARLDPGGGAAKDAVPMSLRGLRVLVVDDSQMNLDVMQRLLQRDGAVITLAHDGRQALDTLRAQPEGFDVVLMDIQMPVMDGLTATRAIRQHPRLSRLPVIALTAGVMPEEREAAVQAGVDDLLGKPVDVRRMRALLSKARSARGSYRSPR